MRFEQRRTLSGALGIAIIATLSGLTPRTALGGEWHGAVGGGGNFNFTPDFVGRGWVTFDALGTGVVGNGDLRTFWNTDKIHVGIERLTFADGKLAFFTFLEGEIVLAQLLRDYFQQGLKIGEFGFNASYVLWSNKLQWYPGRHQTLELLLPIRRWWFYAKGNTSPNYVLPPDSWSFEPRVGYVYWNVTSPASEFAAYRVYPRIEGVALGVRVGLDVRSQSRTWGLDDGRNDPDQLIYLTRQWLRAGWQFAPLARLQLAQWGSYGWGEDDITRERVGGTSPYVVPIPGLPWTGLVSERLFSGELGIHLRAKPESPHEFGALVAGGAFNDVRRVGALGRFGGTGGIALFSDLRFGTAQQYQVNLHFSYGFPVQWLLDNPYLAGLVAFGVSVF